MMETAREAFTRELGSGERRRGLGWRLRSAAAGQPLATMPNQHALVVFAPVVVLRQAGAECAFP
jgi:hypothetical protein